MDQSGWTTWNQPVWQKLMSKKILRKCSCGWSKVTTDQGLQIHQGKAKCNGTNQLQACTAVAVTRRTQSLVKHHGKAETTIADGEREELLQLSQQELHYQQQEHNPQYECHTESTSSKPTREGTSKEMPIHQDKVRWQKASNKEAWRIFEQSLHLILQNLLAGSTTTKLNLFRNTVYDEGKERFGEVPQKKKTPQAER